MNRLLALLPQQGVQNTGATIANGTNNLINIMQQNKVNERRNRLLDLQEENYKANQTIAQNQDKRAQQTHDFKMDQAQGAQLYRTFSVLEGLDPELRASQIELLKPGLRERGFDDNDWELLATDEGIKQGMKALSQYAPALTPDQVLRGEELNIKRDRLTFDQNQAMKELEGLHASVDALDISDDGKKALKTLPAEELGKILVKHNDPKVKAEQKEAAEKEQKAVQLKTDALRLIDDLLADEKLIAENVGPLDSMQPTIMAKSKDFERKFNRLKSILTAENLGMMSGVLSETDLKVIADIAGGELGLDGSEEQFISTLEGLKSRFSSAAKPANNNGVVTWDSL